MLDDEQSERDAVLDSDFDDDDLDDDQETMERRDQQFAADLREYMDQNS